ncbi:Reversal of tor2 lethality [Thecaphora frezii]
MKLSLAALGLGALASALALLPITLAQTTEYGIGVPNNVTSLAGTWCTGACHVLTGLQFYNPISETFTYPLSAGQSYSFTDDGFWEQALYMYNTNPSKPQCVSAQLIWQHGTYTLNSNNTLTLNTFKGDGRQQISDYCAEVSNVVQYYDQKEDMNGFEIHLDTHYGTPAYYLKMYEFDGTPKPIMWQVYNPPQMLPTEHIHQTVIGELNQ